MKATAKQLLEQVMALSEDDRLITCNHLSDSLETETDPEHEAAWETEVRASLEDIDSARTRMIPAEESIRQLRERTGLD